MELSATPSGLPSPDQYQATYDSDMTTEQLMSQAKEAAATVHVNLAKLPKEVWADTLLITLLENAVEDAGKRHTACAILQSHQGGEKQLLNAALSWLQHMLFPIKAIAKKRTVVPTSELTPSLLETDQLMEAARLNQKALRELVLRRDKYRCVVTRRMDYKHEEDMPFSGMKTDVQAAHIMPFSLNAFKEKDVLSFAVTWDMIQTWGSIDLQQLIGTKVNDASNAIALSAEMHNMFGDFMWWFEAIRGEENTYTLCDRNIGIAGRVITFMDHSNGGIPLPNPHFLEVRAAFCRVLHASGAAEYFDDTWDEGEGKGVLSSDGSSDVGALLSWLQLVKTVRVLDL